MLFLVASNFIFGCIWKHAQQFCCAFKNFSLFFPSCCFFLCYINKSFLVLWILDEKNEAHVILSPKVISTLLWLTVASLALENQGATGWRWALTNTSVSLFSLALNCPYVLSTHEKKQLSEILHATKTTSFSLMDRVLISPIIGLSVSGILMFSWVRRKDPFLFDCFLLNEM